MLIFYFKSIFSAKPTKFQIFSASDCSPEDFCMDYMTKIDVQAYLD